MTKRRGRPKSDSSETQNRIIEAAAQLLKAHGVRRVSVEDICKKADLSKVTFYKYFEDKIEIGKIVLENTFQKTLSRSEKILNSDFSFQEKFQLILESNDLYRQDLGEPFLEDLLHDVDPELTQKLAEIAQRAQKINEKFIKQGQTSGVLSKKFSIDFILFVAEQLNGIAKKPELSQIVPNTLDKMHLLNEFFFFGISENK